MSLITRMTHRRILQAVHSRLRYVAGGRFVQHVRPTAVALLLTERCNARCVHCDIWKNKGKEENPTAEEWRTLLSDIRRWLGPINVVFTGGEALLKPYTIELVTHANSLGLFTEVLTHGYWPDQKKIEQLAATNPWFITVSLDGIGETHATIRGFDNFFDRTNLTIETLRRVRTDQRLNYTIRIKTVIMDQNLEDLGRLAEFASRDGMEVFYQPIEQNYNTAEDLRWFETSPNWPRDPEKAVRAVEQLIILKRQGLQIANSIRQLEVMIPYFRNPMTLQRATRAHTATERRQFCAASYLLQIQANGDVTICCSKPPVGNIRRESIRNIWLQRPHWWEEGCCQQDSSRYQEACMTGSDRRLPV
jgi:MoaA/NifB/PqqE/SkfB family radical SAM enzyme